MADIVERLRSMTPTCTCPMCSARRDAANEIECLRARDYELRAGLHVARGALLGIGTDYAKEIADHLAVVLDPSLAPAPTGRQT